MKSGGGGARGGGAASRESQISLRIASLKSELDAAASGGGGGGGGGSGGTKSAAQNAALVEQLQDDLKRRQESYVRRERAYDEQVRELQDEIARLTAGRSDWMEQDEKVRSIREMHKQLMRNVGTVQEKTAKVLEDQERDLLRAFRARLFDIQSELETEKSKADVGASAWIERNRQLERGLDWAKEMADRLERVNQSLQGENSKLKAQYKTQENDREFLIKQLVVVKKDNVQLRQEVEARDATIARLTEENDALALFKRQQMNRAGSAAGGAPDGGSVASGGPGGGGGGGGGGSSSSSSKDAAANPALPSLKAGPSAAAASEADERYKDIIKRLKKLLDTERSNLRKVRAAYSADLKNRTELEVLLRETVADVRDSIVAARNSKRSSGKGSRMSGSSIGGGSGSGGSSNNSFANSGEHSRSQQSLGVAPGGSGLNAASSLRTSSSSALLSAGVGGGGSSSTLDEEGSGMLDASKFSKRDREKVLELLLSQERVVTMLYRKTFPSSKAVPTNFVMDPEAESLVQQDVDKANLAVDKPELEAIVTNRQNKK